ncbi:hypothetical protein [Maritalea sp.]|uniref:hypothetical protein n=1 Tax=Maritalea sp. TaxID=2003361 RepID=UPI003EF1A4EA
MTKFSILRPEFNIETGEVKCHYRLADHEFTERLELGIGFGEDAAKTDAFARTLDLAAAILGVSYFKLLAPKQIDASELKLTLAAQSLIKDIYENGLGEFYARNDLHRFGQIKYHFRTTENTSAEAPSQTNALVLIGGGKDSLLSVNLMEDAQWNFTPFAVNPKGPILSSIDRIDHEPLFARRYLDQKMLKLNQEPGFFNGHVPSTAINSIIAALVAQLYGNNHIILSNERSASEGNLEFDGREVNHQHSKSLNFERLFADALQSVAGSSIRYFSILRPFSELQIGALFAKGTRFDGAFSSCNENFKQDATGPAKWCGNCPKCHFVSLIFAPFMTPDRLTCIVGKNVLDDEGKLAPMRDLSGLTGHKPWECVGEILEAAAALYKLSSQPNWQDAIVVKTLKPELETFYGAQKLRTAWNDAMTPSGEHAIPKNLHSLIEQNEHDDAN